MKYSIRQLIPILSAAKIASPRLEARIILAHVLQKDSVDIGNDEYELSAEACARLQTLLKQRTAHAPLDKLLGVREFYKYRFNVNENVLSPRPDTEILVEAAIKYVFNHNFSSVLDLGTGSGCILLSILADCPSVFGTGVDASRPALNTARENAAALGLSGRCRLLCLDWFSSDFAAGVGGPFDLIVSNPPYIPSAEISALDEEVRNHDPQMALDGGKDGFDHYRRLAEIVPVLLKNEGMLLLEGGMGQAAEISKIFATRGLQPVSILKDLSGIERCIILKK